MLLYFNSLVLTGFRVVVFVDVCLLCWFGLCLLLGLVGGVGVVCAFVWLVVVVLVVFAFVCVVLVIVAYFA